MAGYSEPAAEKGRALTAAFVAPGWPEEHVPNGIVTYIAKMRSALEGRGARVKVLANMVAGGESEPGLIDLRVFRRPYDQLPVLQRLLRKVKPDAVKARWMTDSILAALRDIQAREKVDILQMEDSFGWPENVTRRSPVPVVVRLHGPWFLNGLASGFPKDEAFKRRVAAEGRGIAAADAVTAPSLDVLERTRSHYGLALQGAAVIPNPQQVHPPAERWRLDACDPKQLLFVGRFDRHKGGDVMLDAFAIVLRRFPDAQLWFVGPDRGFADGQGRTWTFGDYLARALPHTAQAERVAWLGRQPRSRIAELRRMALVTVVCSRYETFGNTATEAMATGCPIVATRTGGLAEIVMDGRNGLQVPPNDPAGLAEKLCTLLADPALAARLGGQAVLDCGERHSPDTLAKATLAFYEEVLKGSQAGRKGADSRE